jgi:hypothetical protein
MLIGIYLLLCGTVVAPNQSQGPRLFPVTLPIWSNIFQRQSNISKPNGISPNLNPKTPNPNFNPHQRETTQKGLESQKFQLNPHLRNLPVAQNPIAGPKPSVQNKIGPKLPTNSKLKHHHHPPHPSNAPLIPLSIGNNVKNLCPDGIRLRKEFRDLTQEEWIKFKSTLRSMYEKDATGISPIDRITKVHLDWADEAHYTPHFLPWHRVFTWLMETEMRNRTPGITIPYWNWEFDAKNPQQSPIFNEFYLGTKVGPSGDCNWRVRYPKNHCLVRDYRVIHGFYSEKTLDKIVYNKKFSFAQFAKRFEVGPHGIVHTELNGDMTDMMSPNDPIFWLHHSQVERRFLEWQNYRGRTDEFGGEHLGRKAKITDYLKPFKISIADALDHHRFCTAYQPFSQLSNRPMFLKDSPQSDEERNQGGIIEKKEERMPIGELPLSWIQMIGMEEEEAREIERELRSYEEEAELKSNDPIEKNSNGKCEIRAIKSNSHPNFLLFGILLSFLFLSLMSGSMLVYKRLNKH